MCSLLMVLLKLAMKLGGLLIIYLSYSSSVTAILTFLRPVIFVAYARHAAFLLHDVTFPPPGPAYRNECCDQNAMKILLMIT